MASSPYLRQTLRANAHAVAALLTEVEAWCARYEVDARVTMHLSLMLDEWLTNIVEHGYQGKDGEIDVELSASSVAHVDVVVRDQGRMFDPTRLAAPDIMVGIEEREIGGLGIHLIRRMASHLTYARENETNVLRFGKSADPRA